MVCLISTPSVSLFTRLSPRGRGQQKGGGLLGSENMHKEGKLLTSMQRKAKTKKQTPKCQEERIGTEIIYHPAILKELMLAPGPCSQSCPTLQGTLWWAPPVMQGESAHQQIRHKWSPAAENKQIYTATVSCGEGEDGEG